MSFNVRSISVGVKRELYERVVVPTQTYGAKTFGIKTDERQKLGVRDMRCLQSMC